MCYCMMVTGSKMVDKMISSIVTLHTQSPFSMFIIDVRMMFCMMGILTRGGKRSNEPGSSAPPTTASGAKVPKWFKPSK